MKTTEQAPDPSNPTGQVVKVTTKDQANNRHIQSVLMVMQTLNPYLLTPSDEFEVDKEARLSASVLYLKCADRLEKIIEDDSRWLAEETDILLKSLGTTQSVIQDYYRQSALSVADMRRPSRIFPVKFAKTGNLFSAYHVSSEFPGGILLGVGPTPEEAMKDFDAAFERIPEKQLRFSEEAQAKLLGAKKAKAKPTAKSPRRKK